MPNVPPRAMACITAGSSAISQTTPISCRNSPPSIAGPRIPLPNSGAPRISNSADAMAEPRLDVISIGRVSVALYGQQVGGRLEDMASFAKYVGGCPANISIGGARLSLRTALLSRVGDEHMGRYVHEQLEREGVDTGGLKIDPQRLTALVILGIRDAETFPLIFYRENCADMALSEGDIDE